MQESTVKKTTAKKPAAKKPTAKKPTVKKSKGLKYYVMPRLAVAIIILLLFAAAHIIRSAGASHSPKTETETETAKTTQTTHSPETPEQRLAAFARQNGISLSDYPQSLMDALALNPELEEFVTQYPLRKDKTPAIDLTKEAKSKNVPLLMQWDKRWGYHIYGSDVMGITGCGPTCLSMVLIYLKQDPTYDPWMVARFAMENDYCLPGNGTSWDLISEGGKKLGIDVVEIPLEKSRVMRNIEVGNPIICVMGPGDFTTTGHYIVIVGSQDGKLRVNDPYSRERSEKLWDYDQIESQIRNIWVCR